MIKKIKHSQDMNKIYDFDFKKKLPVQYTSMLEPELKFCYGLLDQPSSVSEKSADRENEIGLHFV